ncbi:SoxR reducing system RseC family protein [Alteromonas pelagimontana]|uniref:SoxR reducing system RseC family protein n=1 Tax=Alteromonas pelagimontana TaxID=1858656 RepID=A0A6M4MHP3_9ALTE|nr:SoxR reducing system RseC family protein [Alteromonas pelagimontana]QJR82095.1 SoxR reducing system RseC family protein [Alteromonas pelagimontana]
MITETARVVAVDGDKVTLEAAIKSTCSSCQAQANCGSGVISRAMAPKTQQLTVTALFPVSVGDSVKVGIPEAGILAASGWLYLVPLLIFIGCALLLTELLPKIGFNSELWVVAGSIAATMAGFIWISGYLKQFDKRRFQPVIFPLQKHVEASVHTAANKDDAESR